MVYVSRNTIVLFFKKIPALGESVFNFERCQYTPKKVVFVVFDRHEDFCKCEIKTFDSQQNQLIAELKQHSY